MNGYHAQEAAQVMTDLKVLPGLGLSAEEAAERQTQYGRNELPHDGRASWWRLLAHQFQNALIGLLLLAGGISLYLRSFADATAIFLAIVLHGAIGFAQEYRAERALEKLKAMIVPESTVLRGGHLHRMPSAQLVPGDLIVLEAGDHVPADARLYDSHDLTASEASLTGESEPVLKSLSPVAVDAGVGDRTDMVWLGTTVAAGEARAVVTAIGAATEFGRLASSLSAIKRTESPLELQVARLGRQLGLAGLAAVVIISVLGLAGGQPLLELFIFAISLTVAVVPEGLPAVIAVALAIGVQRMAKRRAVMRRVRAVDTLGAVDVICTDKTGTLTENRMTVREVALLHRRLQVAGDGWSSEGEVSLDGRHVDLADLPEFNWLAQAVAVTAKASLELRNGEPVVIGDPTEGALVVLAAKAGVRREHLLEELAPIAELPFSAERRCRAVIREHVTLRGEKKRYLFVVGAFGVLRDRATAVMTDGELESFDEAARRLFEAHNAELAARALRVLAVGWREVPPDQASLTDGDLHGLTMLGLVGMIDPPRAHVKEALAQCRTAGIRVIMATGDQKATAVAIARELGLLKPDDDVDRCVFTEKEVVGLDEAAFAAVVDRAVILARVTPATKLRLVKCLQAQGKTVAVTGDGVNDAPALKQADIGVAMGVVGTDVSREVADMVLTDDNFVSIVSAIEEGRLVFRNVKLTTAYLFMTNLGEIAVILGAVLLGLPLPLLPTQVLWMNIVTDGAPVLALAAERNHHGVLKEPPRPRHASLLSHDSLIMSLLVAGVMTVGSLTLYLLYLPLDEAKARTLAFTAMSLFQLWNVLNLRSERRSIFSMSVSSNPAVYLAVALSFIFQILAVSWAPMRSLLKTTPLSAGEWLAVILVTSSVFIVVELWKLYRRLK
jgi:Ca2+-transporting ATPase